MEIRHASREEAGILSALLSHFFAEEGFVASAEEIRERAAVFMTEAANAAFLAVENGVPVGVATVTTGFGFETGRRAEIEDLYVLPDRRRQGVARGLIGAALAWCRERECTDVEVVVTPEGDVRHGLGTWYRGLGFTETGRRILHLRL